MAECLCAVQRLLFYLLRATAAVDARLVSAFARVFASTFAGALASGLAGALANALAGALAEGTTAGLATDFTSTSFLGAACARFNWLIGVFVAEIAGFLGKIAGIFKALLASKIKAVTAG